MLEVGFILPSSDYLHDPFKGDPHTHINLLTHLENSFGKKISPSLIDLRGIKKEFVYRHIPECDLYLHSVYTLDYNEQKGLVQQLRKNYPAAKHIAGGPHVNEFPEESLKIFDSIVLGEGEESIIKAVNDFRISRLQTVYKQESKIDINDYPIPKRHFMPKSTIAREGMMTLKAKPEYSKLLGTTTLFSRGCPYSCAFCAMPKRKEFGKGIRFRDPKLISEEIKYLQKNYGIEGINLLDEMCIPLNKSKAASHLEAIASTGILWRGQTRVDALTPELVNEMKRSGCIALGMGVESASQTALDMINKRIKVGDSKKAIRLLKENGIETRVYMILGLPGEPQDIGKMTWDFIKETEPDLVYLSIFTVRPGTEVFNNPKKFGIKSVNTSWDKTMHLFGRYEDETPTLTFEYETRTPWGKGLSQQKLIDTFLEIQNKLRDRGMTFA